jgi:hypothetical protein
MDLVNFKLAAPLYRRIATIGPLSIYEHGAGRSCTNRNTANYFMAYVVTCCASDLWQPHVQFDSVAFRSTCGFSMEDVGRWMAAEFQEDILRVEVGKQRVGADNEVDGYVTVCTRRGDQDESRRILRRITAKLERELLLHPTGLETAS